MTLIRRGLRWMVQLRHDGRLIRVATKTQNKKLAGEIEAKIITELVEGTYFDKGQDGKKLFQEMAEKFMQEFTSAKTQSSIRRDKQLLGHLLPAFGNLLLKNVTPARITAYKLERRHQGAAPKTINLELGLGKHIFNIGIKQLEWTRDNPFVRIPMEKLPPARTRWFTDDEIKRLYEASDDWLKPIIKLTLSTGLRESDVLDLRWQDIDLKRDVITLQVTKTKRMLGLPMNNAVRELLLGLNKVRHINCDFVFHNGNGERLSASTLRHAFDRACRRANVEDCTFHTLRHTVASKLVQSGISLYQVQMLLGHSTPSMAMRYSHLSPDNLKSVVAVLDQQGDHKKDHSQVDQNGL